MTDDSVTRALAVADAGYAEALRAAVITRVETRTSRVMAADGSLAGYYIDADTWREIRALLERAP